jgi:drug/metabolite transporter (DMT)-like permease
MPSSQPPAHSTFRDYVQLHLVVLAWGFTAILGKLITMPALEVAVWRTGLAAAGLAVIAGMRGQTLRAPRGITLAMLGTGLLIGWHWMLFFLSARIATASVCLAAMPTIMLWSSLTEPLINRSYRWSVGELLMGLVMVGAVWLIYHFEFKHWWGFTVGIASAMLGGVFAVINKQLTPHQPPITICFYQMVGACVGCLLLLPVLSSGKGVLPSLSDLLWLLVLSQVCTVGAYVAYLDLLRRMSVFTINVVYNLEPVYGIVLAALIFGERERMSGGFYLGASVIITAVLAMPFVNRRRNAAAETPQVN